MCTDNHSMNDLLFKSKVSSCRKVIYSNKISILTQLCAITLSVTERILIQSKILFGADII